MDIETETNVLSVLEQLQKDVTQMQTGYNQNLIQNTAIDKSENRIEK